MEKKVKSLTNCSENWLQNALLMRDEYTWSLSMLHDDTVIVYVWKHGMPEPHQVDLWDVVNNTAERAKRRQALRRIK